MKTPYVLAHRGASLHKIENSLPAFELALQQGAHGVEMDLWQCASGEWMVIHDAELTELTGTPGHIEKLNYSELKSRRLYGRTPSSPSQERIPSLEEALELCKNFALINLEIKGNHLRGRGNESLLLKRLKEFRVEDRVLLSSFNPITLYRFKTMAPHLRRGLLFYEGSALPFRRAWSSPWIDPFSLHPSKALLTKELMIRAHRHDQKVFAWTINHLHDVKRCLELDVHGLITDDPAEVLKIIQTQTTPLS